MPPLGSAGWCSLRRGKHPPVHVSCTTAGRECCNSGWFACFARKGKDVMGLPGKHVACPAYLGRSTLLCTPFAAKAPQKFAACVPQCSP